MRSLKYCIFFTNLGCWKGQGAGWRIIKGQGVISSCQKQGRMLLLRHLSSSASVFTELVNKIEPQHHKTSKVSMRPTKTQISLGIHPVWSESSLCTQWVAKDPSFLHVDSEDWSDWANAQADLSLCWAHTHFVGFDMSWLSWPWHKQFS